MSTGKVISLSTKALPGYSCHVFRFQIREASAFLPAWQAIRRLKIKCVGFSVEGLSRRTFRAIANWENV